MPSLRPFVVFGLTAFYSARESKFGLTLTSYVRGSGLVAFVYIGASALFVTGSALLRVDSARTWQWRVLWSVIVGAGVLVALLVLLNRTLRAADVSTVAGGWALGAIIGSQSTIDTEPSDISVEATG